MLCTIKEAIDEIKSGNMIILIDDEKRENEGDLCIAASKITPEAINFMAKYGRGLICLAMSGELIDKLNLDMMPVRNNSKYETPFTMTIEAAQGITTGISAHDRCHTVRTAIDINAKPEDVSSPGHVFPLRAKEGGVLVRQGHTEGSTDLMKLAGLPPAAVICEISNDDGTMARSDDLKLFGHTHNIKMASICDLIKYRNTFDVTEPIIRSSLPKIEEVSRSVIPVKDIGKFIIRVFINRLESRKQYIVLTSQKYSVENPPLVRIHSKCLTGDVFNSIRCDCGEQLYIAMKRIHEENGILIYLPDQEGRGIGLINKIKAYQLQDQGDIDTVDANIQLGFAVDERNYEIAARILKYMGIYMVRLLTNNPNKVDGLINNGIKVIDREPIITEITEENRTYLLTKKNKMHHML